MATDKRPIFLNLFAIQLPIGGLVSVVHRVTGILWVIAIPGLIYLLTLSLQSPAGYAEAVSILHSPWFGPLGILLAFALLHHGLMGLRHLLLDLDIGVELGQARYSAYAILAADLVLTILWSLWLWR